MTNKSDSKKTPPGAGVTELLTNLQTIAMFDIRNIYSLEFGKRNMDYTTVAQRIGRQVLDKRLHRGLTQSELARIAGLTRQKVIAIEKGSLTTAMNAYARALGALDCDVKVVPAAMPTLDELGELF